MAIGDYYVTFPETFKLLICCSEGSAYESYEEDLIRMETESLQFEKSFHLEVLIF